MPTTELVAEPYPTRPVKIITPVTPGSPVDVMARLLSPLLSSRLGQPVVIDNRPGGGGTIGMKAVAQAEPDGHTLLLHSNSFATSAAAYANPGYDARTSFVPIAALGEASWVLVTAPTVPARSVQEFVSWSKANPGQLNFGFGLASGPHIIGEAFKAATGAQIASIPYKGGAQAVTDMLGGRIHMNIGTPATLMPLIRDGKLRPLAVTSAHRNPDLPDVPTFAEVGLPDLTVGFWTGMFAPAGTPAALVDKINTAVNDSLKSSEMRSGMARAGFTATPGSPQDFAEIVRIDLERWARWSEVAGVKPQ
jgi:tripartite-type tricarboxylate transporter receptor subunit TctC